MSARRTRAQIERQAHLDRLLENAVKELRALGLPIADKIEPQIKINRRAVNRLACCFEREGKYTIELSGRASEASDEAIRQLLAHELLHTIRGCRDHGPRWKGYAVQLGAALGFPIRRTVDSAALGIAERHPNYLLVCERCGMHYPRLRRSPLTDHPERYRCRCGGRLRRADAEKETES